MTDNSKINTDATVSFSWFLYQADIALLVSLIKIENILKEKKDNELQNWKLEIEWVEDFSLLNNWNYIELYQVKEYKNTQFHFYREAIEKLFININKHKKSIGFLCTYLEIQDWRSNPPEYSNKKLLESTFPTEDEKSIESKLLKFNYIDILWNNKEQKVFWDYSSIEKEINNKIKNITNISDNTVVAYLREYLTIRIKNYIQEKSINQKKSISTDNAYIDFINIDKDYLGFSKWIYSFLSEVDNNNIIWKFLNNEEFIKWSILISLCKKIQEINLEDIYDSKKSYLKISKDDYINKSKNIIENFLKILTIDKIELILKSLNLETIDINLTSKNNNTFQDYQNKILGLIWDIQLKNYISNIIAYCLDDKDINNIFWKRLILWEDTDEDWVDIRIWKMLNTDYWLNYEFDFLSYFKAKPWNLSQRLEDKFDDLKHSQHVSKYKNIKICCFKCPYSEKHNNLNSKECWNEGCNLFSN